MNGLGLPWTHWLLHLATGGWEPWIELSDGSWVRDSTANIWDDGHE